MMEIIVNDTNILIDLANTGLIGYCSAMDIQFLTTDIVVREIRKSQQKQAVQQFIDSGTLKEISFQGEDAVQFALTYRELERTTNLTPVDCSVMLLAQKMQCRLLTSDQKLKRQAEARGILTNGLLWLTDQMVERQIVTPLLMMNALQTLLETNSRAPRELILERISSYIETINKK